MSNPPAAHAEQVHRLFDEKAADWPGHYRPDGRLLARLTQITRAVAELTSAGSPVLDLGCGSGELTRRLARAGFEPTGCDVSANMLQQARKADREQSVSWVQIEPVWQRLPFGDGSFGTVVSSSVLEYLESPATVFAECARILRPGGTLVITVPNLAHPVRWLEWVGQRATRPDRARRAAVALGGPRLDAYLTYLRISRQRLRRARWLAVAGRAGLTPVPLATRDAGRPTLQLLAFRNDGGTPR